MFALILFHKCFLKSIFGNAIQTIRKYKKHTYIEHEDHSHIQRQPIYFFFQHERSICLCALLILLHLSQFTFVC